MTALNQKCRLYLEMTGHTIYTFSRSANLDVADVHRLVKGNKIPSLDFLRAFMDSLRINETERQELLELYEEETAGHAAYQNRRYIAQIISSLSNAENHVFFHDSIPAAATDMKHTIQACMQACRLLEGIFSRTDRVSEIYCSFPLSLPFSIFDLMLHFHKKYSGRKKFKFRHLIAFSSNPAVQPDSNCNLKILHGILPLIFSGFDEYIPYYYYSHAAESDFFQIPWPYYLVTEDGALLLSADGSSSILHKQPEKILWYRREMEQLLQAAMPLISCSHSAEESLRLYQTYSWPANPIVGYLSCQPCMMPCITEEHFTKRFPAPLSSGPFASLPPLGASSYFSRGGLLNFWKTGEITGQLAAYLPPFSPEERRKALLRFTEKNNGTDDSSRLLKMDIPFPANLYMELLQHHRLLVCMFEKGENIRFILFDEPSIYDAFADFFQYLGLPGNSCSVSETNCFILELLETPQTGGANDVEIK